MVGQGPFPEASACTLLFGETGGKRFCSPLSVIALRCRKEGSWDWQVFPALGIKVLPFDCSRESQALSGYHILFPPLLISNLP